MRRPFQANTLYFFQIVKEPYSLRLKSPEPSKPTACSLPNSHPLGLVEVNGIEPMTSCLQSRRSPN